MIGLKRNGVAWLQAPLGQGLLLLVILIALFLGKPLFTNQPLVAADLLFALDPLWQPLAPPGYTVPANQVLSDQVFEFYGWQKFVRAELAAGRVPLWNPYVNGGHALLANAQAAPFDPFQVVARLWPLDQSFVVVAALRLLCAGTFALLLALALGLSRWAAYLVMVTFTFGLPQVVWLLYPKASVLVWLPALLYFSLQVMRAGKWHSVAALALVMAAQVVGGHPESALYGALLWLIFSGYWLWRRDVLWRAATTTRRAATQLGLAALVGVGMGAAQWLPVAEALWHSEILATRGQSPLTWQGVLLRWQDWLASLTMLMPNFFGNPRHADYWFPYSNFNEQTLYVGVVPLALAVVVYLHGKGRQVAFFKGLGVASLGLALSLPLFPLLAELPPLSVTNSGRLRGIYMLAVAMLAGYGLDMVRQSVREADSSGNGAGNRGRADWLFMRALWALGLLAAVAALGALLVVTLSATQLVELAFTQAQAAQVNPFFARSVEEYRQLAEARVRQMFESFLPTRVSMYLPLLLAAVVWGVWRWGAQWVQSPLRRANAIGALMVILVVSELWLVGLGFNPTVPRTQLYPMHPLITMLRLRSRPHTFGAFASAPPFRVVGTGLTLVPNVGMVFGLEDVRGYDPIASRRYMAVMNALPGAVRVGHHLLFTQGDVPFFDFLNVRYALTPHELGGQWSRLAEFAGVFLYGNEGAMPRAFMVFASQYANTPEESLAMTLSPDFDFRNRVVLEGEAEEIGASRALAPSTLAPPERDPVVSVGEYLPGQMRLYVQTARDGYLVVSDPYVPGWVAQVDGTSTEVLIANHAFRAVAVPAGSHTVTFSYAPMSFAVGVWISVISLVAWMVMLVGAFLLRILNPNSLNKPINKVLTNDAQIKE